MKKHHSMVWSLMALAVMASPLTLDHVYSHSHTHHSLIGRSIASEVETTPTVVADTADAAPVAAPAAPEVTPAPTATVVVATPVAAPRPVYGPVNEVTPARDMKAFNRFLSANRPAIDSISSPFSVVSGESAGDSFRRHEESTIDVFQELRKVKDSIAQLQSSATRDSDSASIRSQLITQIGRLNRLEQDQKGLTDLEQVRTQGANELDLSASTLPSVKEFADEVLANFETLNARIVELRAVPAAAEPVRAAASTEEKPAEATLSSEQERRLARAERLIAEYERKEKQRACAATRTPDVLSQQTQQLQTMLVAMIAQNQSMISMLMMQMQNNMQNSVWGQPSWPSQSYANTGLGSTIAQFGMYTPQPLNPYSMYAQQMGQLNQMTQPQMQMQQPQMIQPQSSFNFGGGQFPSAQFGNFQPFGGQQMTVAAVR